MVTRLLVYDLVVINDNDHDISSRFFKKTEEFASKFLVTLEESIFRYHLACSDVYNIFKFVNHTLMCYRCERVNSY